MGEQWSNSRGITPIVFLRRCSFMATEYHPVDKKDEVRLDKVHAIA